MLSPTFLPWDVGYHLYTYGSILLMLLIIWQVKRSYHGSRLAPKKSCCQRHQKIKQRAKDAAASKARGCSRKEAKEPRELLSLMKSELTSWGSTQTGACHFNLCLKIFRDGTTGIQGGRLQPLQCADPSCNTCNAVARNIKHLLMGGTSLTSSSSAGPPQGSPCIHSMAMPSGLIQQNPEHQAFFSTHFSLPLSTPMVSQFRDQKSFTQSVVQSHTTVSIQDYWTEHLPLTQQIQGLRVLRGPESMCSFMLEEPRVPVSQLVTIQTNSNFIYENQGQQPMKAPLSVLTVNQETTSA
ncbi:PREDICTED: protein FAM205CP homolog, partial [Condylura cristata]|uniref:protein FAM205CP homolog n=1 Tax=Condylura cristata TaxID=143302 RepID=UPI000643987F